MINTRRCSPSRRGRSGMLTMYSPPPARISMNRVIGFSILASHSLAFELGTGVVAVTSASREVATARAVALRIDSDASEALGNARQTRTTRSTQGATVHADGRWTTYSVPRVERIRFWVEK